MNEYHLKITPQADEKLEDIAYFIALDNPLASKRFVTKLIAAFNTVLKRFPESGVKFIQRILDSFYIKLKFPSF